MSTMNICALRRAPFPSRFAPKRVALRSVKLSVRPSRSHRRLTSTLTRASASSDSAKVTLKTETKSVKQYAALHDFCMTIPYAAMVSLLGLKGVVMHQCRFGMVFLIAGIASCVSSALSLKTWRVGANNTRYTLASSGLALGVAATAWSRLQSGASCMTAKIVLTLSVAMVLFLIYNVAAGGNPPKTVH